jgi:hypothetical protein
LDYNINCCSDTDLVFVVFVRIFVPHPQEIVFALVVVEYGGGSLPQ